MKRSGRAMRLSVFVGEADQWHHRPLYCEIVHRAHQSGLAGATVLRGVEGYGATAHIHTSHVFRLSQDVPVLVIIADTEQRIRDFLPQLDELLTSGLVTALRLQIFIGENDRWHRHPLHHEIVRRAHDAGLAGATVLHGIEGYGAGSMIHTTRLLSLSEDLPLLIIIVDEADRIRAFLPELDEIVTEGLVLIDEATVIRYAAVPGQQ